MYLVLILFLVQVCLEQRAVHNVCAYCFGARLSRTACCRDRCLYLVSSIAFYNGARFFRAACYRGQSISVYFLKAFVTATLTIWLPHSIVGHTASVHVC